MAAFAALYRGLMGSFKSLLTSQNFGSEYELLCSELSIQSLRVRLWGESAGLGIENLGDVEHSLISRQDIKPTIVQVLNSISLLLTEIKEIRHKYRPKDLPHVPSYNVKPQPSSRTIPSPPALSSRQRMRRNQNQKSVVAIAKWALRDARKFDEKLRRLKGLIDGLEDISRVASIPRSQQSLIIADEEEEENPPPYSPAGWRPTRPRLSIEGLLSEGNLRTSFPLSRFSEFPRSDILGHHVAMKRYLAVLPSCPNHPVPKAREKLINLLDQQFKELRIDVYDELLRRQQYEPPTLQYLPNITAFHPKRSEARRKLSTLVSDRFGHLLTDIVCEMERRYPELKGDDHPANPPSVESIDPFVPLRGPETRRWGCVGPSSFDDSPPPLLQYRAAHESTLTGWNHHCCRGPTTLQPSRTPHAVSAAAKTLPPTSRASVDIFRSFRVSMEAPTYKVLPAALKKYSINAPWESYALFIVYGDQERCLGMEEKPLILFKQLDKAGKKPVFMLRKIMTTARAEKSGGNLSHQTVAEREVLDPAGGVL